LKDVGSVFGVGWVKGKEFLEMGVDPFRKGVEKTTNAADFRSSFVRLFVNFYSDIKLW
jgi:hypothetical protein